MSKPLLERVAVGYFQRRSAGAKVEAADAIHFLNPEERAGLKRVQRGAIARAALAGTLSASIAAAAEVVANDVADPVKYWLLFGGATLVAAVLEILYLYWDTLRSMHQLASVAGLTLLGEGEESSVLVDGLARAALELPNPIEGPHGINPRRESSKWQLALASLVYKAKVGITNFLVKMLVRRMLGRVFVRSVVMNFLPFVAVPITAVWNGIVSWLILREGRIRAMGPSAAKAMVAHIFDGVTLSPEGRLAVVRAVGAAIVRTQDLHPNLVALLNEVTARTVVTEQLDDVSLFLSSVARLSAGEQRVMRQVLAVALIIDGRFTVRERRLWRDVCEAVGARVDFEPVEALRKAFSLGEADLEAGLDSLVLLPSAPE